MKVIPNIYQAVLYGFQPPPIFQPIFQPQAPPNNQVLDLANQIRRQNRIGENIIAERGIIRRYEREKNERERRIIDEHKAETRRKRILAQLHRAHKHHREDFYQQFRGQRRYLFIFTYINDMGLIVTQLQDSYYATKDYLDFVRIILESTGVDLQQLEQHQTHTGITYYSYIVNDVVRYAFYNVFAARDNVVDMNIW